MATAFGVRSTVVIPIVVEGHTWGALIVASSGPEPLPADTVSRAAQFTGLTATAIANAEARRELSRLVEEQAALRRVAVLVAREASTTEILDAVVLEAARVLEVEAVGLMRFGPDTATVVAQSPAPFDTDPVGTQYTLEGDNALAEIARTGQAVRIDDWTSATGAVADEARYRGVRSTVSTPIDAHGRLWGILIASTSAAEPLPGDTETRIAQFAGLVATAISNAEGRDALKRLADEQAALRRVAELVAREASPTEIFDAVTREAALVLRTEAVGLLRFESNASATLLAQSQTPWDPPPLGSQFPLDGENPIAQVARTGEAMRLDDWSDATGAVAAMATVLGVRSCVATPILVHGRLWGTLIAATDGAEPLPSETESRIAQFTGLVATAISNAESRDAITRLADEQAALRRVATLVAQGASPQVLFDAVAEEIGHLLPAANVSMGRYEPDDLVTSMASWSSGGPAFAPGGRWPIKGTNVAWMVLQTGKPARVDDFSTAIDPIGVAVREAGYISAVGCPIVVDGHLWGAISAASVEGPMPPGSEERLTAFTQLVATAMANAESQEARAVLTEEQAALRRVATLVAEGVPPSEIFSAVTKEVEGILHLEDDSSASTTVVRFDEGQESVLVGASRVIDETPMGMRWTPHDIYVSSRVLWTGRSARVEHRDIAASEGPEAEKLLRQGFLSQVGCPIIVEGRLWGAMTVSRRESLPPGIEGRLEKFTELVATAISNAEGREAITRLAVEQAALRRVATLVAAGVPPTVIFTSVSHEIEHIFRLEEASTDRVTVIRFDPGPTSVMVGSAKDDPEEPIGLAWDPKPLYVSTKVLTTGASARIDEQELGSVGGPDAVALRRRGILCQVGSPIVVRRRLWGAVTLNAGATLPPDTEKRLEKFTELVATAVANAEAQSDLAASRRRIVSASDEARRQIERDLHDGTQQRLVSLGLALRAAEAMVPSDQPELRVELSDIAAGLTGAVEDLQELSRGIHPAILSTGGLIPALRTLARRSAIPVDLDLPNEVAVPESVEVAAYFVTSEAFANAAKHAKASHVDVSLAIVGATLELVIRDDGVGGADVTSGSGLIGLSDRVEALGGSVTVDSPPGEGTTITTRLPIQPEGDRALETPAQGPT